MESDGGDGGGGGGDGGGRRSSVAHGESGSGGGRGTSAFLSQGFERDLRPPPSFDRDQGLILSCSIIKHSWANLPPADGRKARRVPILDFERAL